MSANDAIVMNGIILMVLRLFIDSLILIHEIAGRIYGLKETMNKRSKEVLKCVIETYVITAEPVGSRAIAKRIDTKLSAATVRNVMSDLTDIGLIEQPHTSSGRIPTDKGYRYYVNKILNITNRDRKKVLSADKQLVESHPDRLEDILHEITSELSRITNFIGILIPPQPAVSKLKKIELIKLSSNQLLVIVVTQIGLVRNKIISLRECPKQELLNKISTTLCNIFEGKTLAEIRSNLIDSLAKNKVLLGKMLPQTIRIGKKAFDITVADDLLVYGHSKICSFPEFSDQVNLEEVYRVVEDKNVLNNILADAMESRDISIKIGNEIQYDGLAHCSVVSSTYGNDDYLLGSIGVVGPTRMNYSLTVSAIDYSAQKLSWAVRRFLSSD